MTTAIEVDTRDYEFSHGRKPRGPGGWAFFFTRHAPVDEAFWVEGTYREARAEARDEARRRGVRRVFVGS